MRLAPRPWPRPAILAISGLLLLLGLLIPSAAAESRLRNPLRGISLVEDAKLHSASGRVNALSNFQISFTLQQESSGRRLPVRFRLEPDHNVLADNAAIHHINADGSLSVEPIKRLDHRVFWGNVFVEDHYHNHWTNVGWTSLYVHIDGKRPVFEGAFHLGGDHYHIMTSANYRSTRLPGDPLLPIAAHPDREYMVVWRDSDILPDEALRDVSTVRELRRRSDGTYGDFGVMSQPVCSSDGLLFNTNDMHPVFRGAGLDSDVDALAPSGTDSSRRWLFGRQLFGRQTDGSTGSTGGNSAGVNLTSTIGNSAGCPTARKVALLGVAVDCNYAAALGSRSNISANVISQISTTSRVYENAFNISLGIQNITIANTSCPTTNAETSPTPWSAACTSSLTITDRLSLFSKWRGTQPNDTNAFWMMLSTCPTDSAVGLAWLGQLCSEGSTTDSSSNETIAAANVVVRSGGAEWQVMAHETGHTFGAVHDCVSSTCSDGTATKQQCCPLSSSTCNANGQYIMNPSTATGITQFSPCTIGNICSALGRNSVKSSCLTNNKNITTISGSECGNGIVEDGEDCDCGGTAGCGDNPCCNPTTCKFATNALCDPSNSECCTSTCQLASNGTVCRASTGSCDPAETCSGTSATCPDNQNAPDGTSCGASSSGLTCASGQCTSRDLQCKTLMGSITTNNDTYACSSSGCQLSCASPQFGSGVCYSMMQNFLDGTPCQGGGKCNNGNCDGVSVTKEIGNALKSHLDIVIPVASVVGGLILLALLSCLWSCIRRRRRQSRRLQSGMPPPMQPGVGPAMAMTPANGWRNGPAGPAGSAANASRNTLVRKSAGTPPGSGQRRSWFLGGGARNDNAQTKTVDTDNSSVGNLRSVNNNGNGTGAGGMAVLPPSVGPWRDAGYGGGAEGYDRPPPGGPPPPPPHGEPVMSGGYNSPPPPYTQGQTRSQNRDQWVPPFRGPSVRYA